ncbi:unnamed protein product [Rotaria socialis]|uniref:Uncharacterized protein n=1 Tax=Rotaria socialis TaxID=392032 RepID=A0A818G1D9_9BILA|nr:unnamed protein product [Rotaria socialis]
MFNIVVEIAICAILGIGIIVVLILCNRNIYRAYQRNSNSDEREKIEFLSTSTNEDFLIQNALITYYEQQRNELIERQKMILDDSKFDTIVLKNNYSHYTAISSQTHTPQSLYEYSGFASLDNLEISNPLFSTDTYCDNDQLSLTIPLITP